MDDTTQTMAGHRVPAGLGGLRAQVGDLLQSSLLGLGEDETRTALCEVTALAAQVAALELALAVHGHDVGVEDATAATSTGVWWAVATRQTRRSASGKVKLALALECRWRRVQAGLGAGRVLPEQAQVIVKALEDLPADLGEELLGRAEEVLVGYAGSHDAAELAVLGAHVLTVIAPEIGEERDRKRLEKAEQDAAAKRRFSMVRDGHGAVRGRFTLPALQGAMLEKALQALAAPKHRQASGAVPIDASRPTAQKLGEAFAELVETLDPATLPKAGRMNATVVVKIDLTDLLTRIGYATLDDGTLVSAGEARRLACEAGLIPAVLDGPSEVLDVGRGHGSTPTPSASTSTSATAGAPRWDVTGRPRCVTPTTTPPGPRAAPPTRSTAGCCAPATMPGPTTPATRCASAPTTRSPSTGGPRPTPAP